MKIEFPKTVALAALAALVLTLSARAQDKEPLALQLPAPTLKGTPEDLPSGPNIETYSDKAPPAFMVPKGVKNVAAGKTATSSVKPFTGEMEQLTDGKKEAFDYDSVEMKKGTQWVQVDLGESCTIYAVALWHDHRYIQVMHDVIVQISDDPEFKTGVTTVYNNDTDNSSGLGVGTDREYFETKFGRIVDGKGTKGRYVRGYTKGGSLSALNCWQELEVYALPAKPQALLLLPATATIATLPPVIVQSSEPGAVSVVSVEADRAETAPVQVVQQTTTTDNSVRIHRAPVNVTAQTQVQVSVENPAPAPQVVATATSAPAVSGFNWIGGALAVFSAALLLIGLRALAHDPIGARASLSGAK